MIFRRNTSYLITPRDDEWTGPEESLVDAGSALADLEAPVSGAIFRVAGIVAGVVLLLLLFGGIRLTVFKYDQMAYLSAVNRTVTVAVPPPRGLVLDRNGTHLVENVPSFDILAVTRQIERTTDGTVNAVPILSSVLGVESEVLARQLDQDMRRSAVFFIATDIGQDAMLALVKDIPEGFYLITSTKRDYTDSRRFSSLLGYVGKVSRADMAEDPYYLPSDTIGRAGIESSYEELLRGAHGQLTFENAEPYQHYASQGHSLVLHVDADAQRHLYDAFVDVLAEAGLSKGAAVVQDPSSGAVLALVSFPSFDNDVFNRQLSQEQFSELFENPDRPLFNRAMSGRYNPGSTIKPFIGMSALQAGVISSGTTIPDCNAISIPNPSDPSDPYVFRNWRPEAGSFDLYRAIADSCNIFFFAAGGGHGDISGLGIERIVKDLRTAYADTLLGIDLPGEEVGFVPDPDWKWITRKEPWYQGDTYNISIGQGDLSVTPLWLNTYVGAIANGGTLWQPQVGMKALDTEGQTVEVNGPVPLGTLPFDQKTIQEVRIGMRRTVTDGTAKPLGDIGVSAAAKTGTAEVIKGSRINSLLTVYAPAENPQIAMTVLVEGSEENQGYAIRVADRFLTWFFGTRDPDDPEPEPSATPSPGV